MHVNKNRLGDSLLAIEKSHIAICTECTYEHQMLSQLKNNATEIELVSPPIANWMAIAAKIENNKKCQKSSIGQVLFAIAASTIFFTTSWLMWSNYQLQNQLAVVLEVNQHIELQLAEYTQPRVNQQYLLQNISVVDNKLTTEQSLKNKVALLKQRSELMSKVLEYQQGESHEFSI